MLTITPEEIDFQSILDKNPTRHNIRLVLADHLEECGDIRFHGYRWLGQNYKYPKTTRRQLSITWKTTQWYWRSSISIHNPLFKICKLSPNFLPYQIFSYLSKITPRSWNFHPENSIVSYLTRQKAENMFAEAYYKWYMDQMDTGNFFKKVEFPKSQEIFGLDKT